MSGQEKESQSLNLSEVDQSIRKFISDGKLSVNGTSVSGEMFDLFLRMREKDAVEDAISKHVERMNQLVLQTKEKMNAVEASIQEQRQVNAQLRLEKEGLRQKLDFEQQKTNQAAQWYQQQLALEKQSLAAQIQTLKGQHLNELGQLRMEVTSAGMRASIQEKMMVLSQQYPGLKEQSQIGPKLIDAGIHVGKEAATHGLRYVLGTRQPGQ